MDSVPITDISIRLRYNHPYSDGENCKKKMNNMEEGVTTDHCHTKDTVCPRSVDPFHIISYYIIWILDIQ